MDIKQSNDYKIEKYENLKKFNLTGNQKYDYAKEGILRKCMPKIIFNEGNTILVSFLQMIDLHLIMLLKYIEKLKKFKYISWY